MPVYNNKSCEKDFIQKKKGSILERLLSLNDT